MSENITILAVEDNEADRKLLSHALKQNGYKGKFLTAGSANEAYRLMVQRIDESLPLPNLVLLDLEMLQKLKSEKGLQQMKVVVFSGSKSTKNMSKAKELGAEWYFVKPDNPSDLRYIAQELVNISER